MQWWSVTGACVCVSVAPGQSVSHTLVSTSSSWLSIASMCVFGFNLSSGFSPQTQTWGCLDRPIRQVFIAFDVHGSIPWFNHVRFLREEQLFNWVSHPPSQPLSLLPPSSSSISFSVPLGFSHTQMWTRAVCFYLQHFCSSSSVWLCGNWAKPGRLRRVKVNRTWDKTWRMISGRSRKTSTGDRDKAARPLGRW